MKRTAFLATALVLLSGMVSAQQAAQSKTTQPAQHAVASQAQSKLLPYQDAKLPVEQRITDLLQRMTLAEKLAMLGTDPTVPRLGIVGTNHVEGLHGLALGGPGGWGGRGLVTPTTQFPQSHGLGQTWDPDLLR
jgi:beta-glucosidase